MPFREIAETIGRMLGLPTRSVSQQDAESYFGFLAPFVGVDGPVSSAITRTTLGWRPTHPKLIADLEQGHYFAQPQD